MSCSAGSSGAKFGRDLGGVNGSDRDDAGTSLTRAPGRQLRRLPRLPRRDHRQRRVPLDPGVVLRHHDRSAVLGAQRLQHRLRGLADPVRAAHRPGRSTTVVRGRRRRVHRGVRGVRPRPVGRAAHPGPGLPGLRRGDARAGLAGPGHRGLPAGAARPRHRRVGSVGRGRRRRRTADRWRPGAARRLALGLPRQPALRPGRGVGGAPPAGREPGPGPARHARPRRRGPPRRQPGPAEPGHHQGC